MNFIYRYMCMCVYIYSIFWKWCSLKARIESFIVSDLCAQDVFIIGSCLIISL